MSQQGKRKTKNLLNFYVQQKIQSLLAYFMRVLNLCILQDSILLTGICASQPSLTLSVPDCSYSTRH